MLPSVQGAEGSATDIGNGVRDLFGSFLNGPAIKTIALEARLESQALEEAKQKGCPRVLVTTLTVKHGGGLMSKAIGQGLSAAAWHAPVPIGSVAGAAVRSAVMGGAQTVSTLASSTRARDEMQIEYRLAPSGNEALALFQSEKPSVVLLDTTLPDIDGFEVARQIRRLESSTGERTPLIGVVPLAFEGDQRACLNAGMDEMLLKPISPDIIDMLLKRFLPRFSHSLHG